MADLSRILVFILCGISVVAALTGKGYFCRDPDTGFLHPANSTWKSTSFCGNYTCNLRKKGFNNKSLLRTLNVTFVEDTISENTKNISSKENNENSNVTNLLADDKPLSNVLRSNIPEIAILKTLLPLSLNDISKLNNNERLKHNPLMKDANSVETGDRFLTDEEIKTISDLLHNVKKSDLEAIVDIYNLAQDIYKEMDKMTSENILEETMRHVNNKPANQQKYWYEPTYQGAVKSDMDHQASNVITSTTIPSSNSNSYFGGALTQADFGKLPYYYPMSSFHRQSSYVHPNYNLQPPLPYKPPCNSQANNIPPPPIPPPAFLPPALPVVQPPAPPAVPLIPSSAIPYPSPAYYSQPQLYGGVMKKPFVVEPQKQITPSNLLPYPFSFIQQHHNMSSYPYQSYDLSTDDLSKVNNNNQKSYYKSQFSHSPSNDISSAVEKKETDVNIETDKNTSEVENLIDTLLANAKALTNSKPLWQTDPLPAHVLEEVRAHFEEKAKLLKPLSLRKKVKVERVGKVIKLDDLLREKRSLADEEKQEDKLEEDLEAYIEKTTCLSEDIDPGYFRMGNMSEPYPACCPQRIDNNR